MMRLPWRDLAVAAALALACSARAMAHAMIKQSSPAQDAVLAGAPKEVTLTFNEKVEAMFTSAKVVNAAGSAVSKSKAVVDPADGATVRLPLPALAAGKYTVKWQAVGSDGHRRNGEIRFSVK
jgi:hypothetical protein